METVGMMARDGKIHLSVKKRGQSFLYYTAYDFTSTTGHLVTIDKVTASPWGNVGEAWFNRFDTSTETKDGYDVPIFFSSMFAKERNSVSLASKYFGYVT